MRTVILPHDDLSGDYDAIARDIAGTMDVHHSFTKYTDDIMKNGAPDLVVMDYSWLQCLPYYRFSDANFNSMAQVPHIIIDATPQQNLNLYGRDEILNTIGALPPEDTHAPFFKTNAKNRLTTAIQYFEKLKASLPEETHITARMFTPLMDRIKASPAARRAAMCYAAA